MNNSDDHSQSVLPFMAGLGMGFLAGMLYDSNRGDKLKTFFADTTSRARSELSGKLKRTKDNVEEKAETLPKDFIQEAKKTMHEAKEELDLLR